MKNYALMNLLKDPGNKKLFLYFRESGAAGKFISRSANQKLIDRASGIYFGEEFCEYLTPTLRQIKDNLAICYGLNKSFALVTTAASEGLIKSYMKIFEFLNKHSGTEVIVNDWGILHVLGRDFKNIKPVLGRLLTKSKRYIYKKFLPDSEGLPERHIPAIRRNQLRILRQTNFSLKEYREFLKNHAIDKIDIDIPPQGIVVDEDWEFDFGFYYPWGYLTSARTCPYNPKGNFYPSSFGCRQKGCLKHSGALIKSSQWNNELLELGNSLLYKINLTKIPNFIKRIIYQVDIPKSEDQLKDFPVSFL